MALLGLFSQWHPKRASSPTKKRKPACMWCIISIWQIVLESRFKIHSVQAVIDSENPSAPQGHIISRDVYHSNRSGEQIMRR